MASFATATEERLGEFGLTAGLQVGDQSSKIPRYRPAGGRPIGANGPPSLKEVAATWARIEKSAVGLIGQLIEVQLDDVGFNFHRRGIARAGALTRKTAMTS